MKRTLASLGILMCPQGTCGPNDFELHRLVNLVEKRPGLEQQLTNAGA